MSRIMLAEDDLTMVTLLKTLLGMEGYQVIALSVEDDDVFEAVRNDRPDVLLLDVHLPHINGLDGANDFLLKPYMPDDLLKTLERNLSPS
jgi:DNA-binding response OmpR family regulator